YGKVASILGIFLNIFLFSIKFLIGTLFNSVSIRADAFNNLSDAGSSLISFVSFILSSRPADEEHPFGHERFEYICSLFVSFLILFFSFELIMSSIKQIIRPSVLKFDILMVLVLIISILVKLFMYYYNTKYGKKIKSSVMRATALDSISDVMATTAVSIAIIISHWTGINLDGYMGVFVAIVIGKAGFEIVRDTLNELLGQAPDPVFINEVVSKILAYEGVLGIHDLVVHSYGENKTFITIHVEVSAHEDILISHDLMDVIEKDFKQKENIDLVIHMDPVDFDDPYTNALRNETLKAIQTIDPALSMHDFRVVRGNTHNNLIFDVVVPFHFKMSNEDLLMEILNHLPQNEDGIKNEAVITLDSAYTSIVSHEKIK
ncbi:MAG: cation transporter, partial [Erysipelotrichia bacterium]|nr:cation transporter [Erysipelotrichia bacterium]